VTAAAAGAGAVDAVDATPVASWSAAGWELGGSDAGLHVDAGADSAGYVCGPKQQDQGLSIVSGCVKEEV